MNKLHLFVWDYEEKPGQFCAVNVNSVYEYVYVHMYMYICICICTVPAIKHDPCISACSHLFVCDVALTENFQIPCCL